MPDLLVNWIGAFLGGRELSVVYGGEYSASRIVISGVTRIRYIAMF